MPYVRLNFVKIFIFIVYSSSYIISDTNSNQCIPGKVQNGVTLSAGINAGKYIEGTDVNNDMDCASQCCNESQCDVAFMLGRKCFLVICSSYANCSMKVANFSPMNPRLIYVTRTNNEGVLHSMFSDDQSPPWRQFICPPMVQLKRVTLKGGLNNAEFTDIGPVDSLQTCYDICCQKENCDLAFVLALNCFTVNCKKGDNRTGCALETTVESGFNPEAAHILSRIHPEFENTNPYDSWKLPSISPPKLDSSPMLDYNSNSYQFYPNSFGLSNPIDQGPAVPDYGQNNLFFTYQPSNNNPYVNDVNNEKTLSQSFVPNSFYFSQPQELTSPKPKDIMKGYFMIDASKLQETTPSPTTAALLPVLDSECSFSPVLEMVSLKYGKKAGKIIKHSNFEGSAEDCAKECCKSNDKKFICHIAMSVSEFCYFINCHNSSSCSLVDSTASFKPKIIKVRKIQEPEILVTEKPATTTTTTSSPVQNTTTKPNPFNERPKTDAEIDRGKQIKISGTSSFTNCRHEQIFLNMTLEGVSEDSQSNSMSNKENKRAAKILADHVADMAACTELCCKDKSCDAVVMQEGNCLSLNCNENPRACIPVAIKKHAGDSQIAFMSRIETSNVVKDESQKNFLLWGGVAGSAFIIVCVLVGTVVTVKRINENKRKYFRRKPIRSQKNINRGEKANAEGDEEHDKLEELLSRVSATILKNKSRPS